MKGGEKMKNSLIITIIVAVIVGAGAFYAGMQYQKSQRPTFGNGQFSRQFQNGQAGQSGARQGFGARPVTGEIISSDDKTVTVKMQDGSSKIVILSDKTSINKAAEATVADLKSGERISAFGTENPDGSITAQNIQLNPVFRMQERGASPMQQGK